MNTSTELTYNKQASNRAKIATAIVGILVLLSLFFISFTVDKRTENTEEGILVNFGTTDVGSGDIQPETTTEQQASKPEPEREVTSPATPASAPEKEVSEEETLTQTEETVQVTKPNKNKQKTNQKETKTEDTEQTEETNEPEKPSIDERALYPGKRNTKSTNEGQTGQAGDQGSTDGVPESGAYSGNNAGLGDNGIGYDLAGRKLITPPSLTDNSNAQGKITVKIKVDQQGNVISASLGVPTTISNSGLIKKAIAAAKKAQFDRNANAAEEQFGSITFVFRVT